jgi:hypothetical protein
MKVRRVDPFSDPRWNKLVQAHPDGGVFHTTEWMDALRRTYGYEVLAYAIEERNQLVSGIPFCKVKSFVTGSRLVSMPFSDHCQPLTQRGDDLDELLRAAQAEAESDGLKYTEIRPLFSDEGRLQAMANLVKSNSVVVHKLDITPSEGDLLQTFHKDCIRRSIARSEREHLIYEEGRSDELLSRFYKLLVLTRRRHQIPPQPLAWFRNLIECLGEKLKICVLSKDEAPIASIITLSFKNVITDKYSCADARFNSLGGTVFLLWQLIRQARSQGFTELDLGRSDYATPGLITFKDRWGAAGIPVDYYRYPRSAATNDPSDSRLVMAGKRFITNVPDSMFIALGRLLYRHVA